MAKARTAPEAGAIAYVVATVDCHGETESIYCRTRQQAEDIYARETERDRNFGAQIYFYDKHNRLARAR